jgi:hypothetical protein
MGGAKRWLVMLATIAALTSCRIGQLEVGRTAVVHRAILNGHEEWVVDFLVPEEGRKKTGGQGETHVYASSCTSFGKAVDTGYGIDVVRRIVHNGAAFYVYRFTIFDLNQERSEIRPAPVSDNLLTLKRMGCAFFEPGYSYYSLDYRSSIARLRFIDRLW